MNHYLTSNAAIDRATYAHAFGMMHDRIEGEPWLCKAAAVVAYKAMIALVYVDDTTYFKPNGGRAPKTLKRREIERARLDTLLNVLADFPTYPLGSTTFAVEEALRTHLYPNATNVWSPNVRP